MEGMVLGRCGQRVREEMRLAVELMDQTEVVNGYLIVHWDQRYEDELRVLTGNGKERAAVNLN